MKNPNDAMNQRREGSEMKIKLKKKKLNEVSNFGEIG